MGVKDMLLERNQVVVVGQHEYVVVEVDNVASLFLRTDAQLVASHHNVVLHSMQRVGEQQCKGIQQLHEAQIHLEQLGDGVQRAHQQTINRTIAQQKHGGLNDVT